MTRSETITSVHEAQAAPPGMDAPGGDHRLPSRTEDGGIDYPWVEPPSPGSIIWLVDGIGWVRMPLPWALDHINLYLLPDSMAGTAGRFALVDTGIRSAETRRLWRHLARQLGAAHPGELFTRVMLTHHHPDHLGLAGWFAERFRLPVHASRICWLYAHSLWHHKNRRVPEEVILFFRRAGFSEDRLEKVRAGGWGRYRQAVARLPIGMRRLVPDDPIVLRDTVWWPIETAGHAPGHISLYCAERGILVSGDQLLPEISSNVSVYPGEPFGNPLAEWLVSLARLKALPEDTLVLPAHNRPFRGLHHRVDRLITKHLDRLAAVATLCHKEKCSAVELFPALYRRRVQGMEVMMAAGEAIAHLHFLEAEGVVTREEGADGIARFQARREFDPRPVLTRLARATDKERKTAPWAKVR
ncbi:MAG: MBL fold metallo-hydrolase [Alphaproteobacteria bacterium]|nr:MAG: MBL fold metallo-hydrolase [Alphaproteobacteria bacterium]